MATSQVGGLPLFSDTTATEVTEATDSGLALLTSGVVTAIALSGDAGEYLDGSGAFSTPAGGGAGGASAPDVIEPTSRDMFATAGGTALTANTAYFFKFRPVADKTVTTIQTYVGTSSPTGNIDVGLYDSADGGVTLTRQRSIGSTAISASAGLKSYAITSFDLVGGTDYWLAVAIDNAVDTLARIAVIAAIAGANNRALSKASSFPLPASAATFAVPSSKYYLGIL